MHRVWDDLAVGLTALVFAGMNWFCYNQNWFTKYPWQGYLLRWGGTTVLVLIAAYFSLKLLADYQRHVQIERLAKRLGR